MKTCKDCIYYKSNFAECRFMPEPVRIKNEDTHWCGQLKEKPTFDSDFGEGDEKT